MILQFDINNLDISCTNTEPVINDSSNFVKAVFNFQGEVWDNNNINTAIFHQNDKSYSVILEDNWCYIPFEVLKHGGFTVGIMSKYSDNDTVTTVCTRPCFISTNLSCYSDKFEKPITPSQYEQIMALISSGGGGTGAGAIEAIKVNGKTLIITNKSVDIPVPTKTSDLQNDSGYLVEHQDISGKEDISNKVTSVSSTSTDTEYPSAKCIYELIGDIETLLGGI